MNTPIYLREKKSGNFEFTTKDNATHTFSSIDELKEWYDSRTKAFNQPSARWNGKLIKATYKQSQTYFYRFEEIEMKLNQSNH